jgi:Fe2+ or Zn2+ uptake regulation protein
VTGSKPFRATAQRSQVLEVVREAEGHLTAGEIFERVRQRDARIAYGTVYRTLHLLAERGVIQELTFADAASRYDKRIDRHDHVSCRACGLLLDVDVPVALDRPPRRRGAERVRGREPPHGLRGPVPDVPIIGAR